MTQPLVSVVIPTHNRPELLKRALASVYAQTFTDFEVIVVDDGDSPRAEQSVANYRGRDGFTYLETKKNTGGAATRNVGIEQAQGELIAFLDDDDEWLPEKLKVQLQVYDAVDRATTGFIFSAVENVYEDHTDITSVDESVRDYATIALKRFNGFLTSSLLIPKRILHEVGGFDGLLPSHQEPDLIIRIAQGYQGIGINTPLVRMRMSSIDDHIGGNLARRIRGREMLITKHINLYNLRPEDLAHSYQWLAYRYRESNDYSRAKEYMQRALQTEYSHGRLLNLVKFMIMNPKHWVVKHIFGPEHYGNLQRRFYVNKYLPHLEVSSPQILDAGCGHGLHTVKLLERYPDAHIEAIDIKHSDNWKTFSDNQKVLFKVADLKDYNEVEKNDLVASIDVLEHIRDNKVALEKICKSLKQGGFLYLAVPCDATAPFIFPDRWFGQFKEWEKEEHVGEQWLLEEWKEMIVREGLKIIVARYTFTIWGRFAWEIQYLLRGNKWGDRLNLLLMPLYRLFALLDVYLPIGKGNNLIVARKD